MKASLTGAALLSLGSAAQAQSIVSNCPATNVCYKLNVPDTTASSGSGDIYFQISAPTTYSWVALGQGSGMRGSNMFVMYTSSNGQNVTVSPRLGTGYNMPRYNSAAQLEVLEGSGVSNGMMTANVKCSNCNSWGESGKMDFSSTAASNWIYGYLSGEPLNSDDVEETAATTPASAGTSMGTGSSSGGGSSVSSKLIIAHGVIASVAFIAVFPIGGIIIRLASFTGLPWVHAAIQILGYLIFTVAFGMGIWIARNLDLLSNHHPIIGIVLFVLLFAQPFGGILHHRMYKKTGRRSIVSHLHVNLGRVAIILGIINGGLGLRLASVSKKYVIAYSVCAGVMGAAYIAAMIVGEVKKARKGPSELSKFEKHEVSSEEGISKVGTSSHR
ncbi:related to cellobiose dehydrogenase [Ramularia collo-cygni]|uniref:Related to cellobiose dehydrogenase n=1 Tax=Ramularia collo-cygni TaxID=112498 RepID=A0A2D3V9Q9_9PEZI|nr:related to cellobiose dehydrogenase [Ramularia collo-cygni]CZT17153.1 related to cellobiose dehydrogenase [Ramularia collo-cygni]